MKTEHLTKGKRMTKKKSENNADTQSDYLTLDGVANYLSISRMNLYNIIKDENSNFPKGFEIVRSERNRPKKLYKKEDIVAWLENSPRS